MLYNDGPTKQYIEGFNWGTVGTTELIAEYPVLAEGDPPYNLTGHPNLRKLFIYNGTNPLPNEDREGAEADPDEEDAEADPEDYFQEDTDSEGERERDMYEGKPKEITGIKDKLANLPCGASESGKLFIGLGYDSDSEEDENSVVINPPLEEALSMGDNMEKQTRMNKNSLPPDKRKRRSGRFKPAKPTISYVSDSTLAKLDFDYDDIVKDMNEDELKKCTAKIGDERCVCVAKCLKIAYHPPKDQTYISLEKRRSEKLDNSLQTIVGWETYCLTTLTREGTKLRQGMVTTCLHDCTVRGWNTYGVVNEADAILAAIRAECKNLNAQNKCVLVFVLNETGDGPAPNTLPVQKYEITGKDTTDKGRIGFCNSLADGGLLYEIIQNSQYEDLKNEGCTSWGIQFYVVRCSQDVYDSTELAEDASALFSAGVTQLEKLQKSVGRQHSGFHFWVFTLTEGDTKGSSLYGVLTSSKNQDISKCIGSSGGRQICSGPKEKHKADSSFKDIEVGEDHGREWKSTKGRFWIEKKEAKTDEWYEAKRITVARPASWYKKKRIRVVPPPNFSTVKAVPLAELDLTD